MSLSILFDNASFMHTKDLTDISNFPSKNSVPEIHKMGGVSPLSLLPMNPLWTRIHRLN